MKKYGWLLILVTILVMIAAGNATAESITLSCTQAGQDGNVQMLLNESIDFDIQISGAADYTGLNVTLYGIDNPVSVPIGEDGHGQYHWMARQNGQFSVYASIWITDENEEEQEVTSNEIPIRVTVAKENNWGDAVPRVASTGDLLVPHNGEFTIEVNSMEHAEYFYAFISNNAGDTIKLGELVPAQPGTTTTLNIPVAECNVGEQYWVSIGAVRAGAYDATLERYVQITVTEDVCQHINTMYEEGWAEGTQFTYTDEQYHYASGTWTEKWVCTDCGTVIDTAAETELECSERHSFDGEGKCGLCNYQCLHNGEHEFVLNDWESATCTEIAGNNEYHTVAGEGTEVCGNCGSILNDPENESISFYQIHNYNGDTVCADCEHVCTHDFSENGYCRYCWTACLHNGLDNVQEQSRETEGYGCFDDAEHKVYPCTETYKICPECGIEIIINSEVHNDREALRSEAHQYENGQCTICYSNCCHTGIENAEEVLSEAPGFGMIDAQTHGYGTCNEVRKECPHCHLMVFFGNRLVTMAEGYEAETHHFDENGYCSDCGYQCPHAAWNNGVCTNCEMICPHDNTVYETGWAEDAQITSIDEMNHYVNGTWEQNWVCQDCGTITSTDGEHVEGYQAHSYYHTLIGEETAVCTDCGHENGCGHTDTYESIVWGEEATYTPADEENHTAHGPATVYAVCNECEMYISVTEEDELQRSESHSFDGEGKCGQCDYQCQHSGERGFTLDDWDSARCTEIEGDNEYHNVTGEGTETCSNCGAIMNVPGDNNVSFTDYHHYNDGVCTDCEHVCTHDFDGNGNCRYCGTACLHNGLDDVQEQSRETEGYECFDDAEHKVYACTETYKICPECGIEIIINREVHNDREALRSEAHQYENGQCTICYSNCCHTGIENAEEALSEAPGFGMIDAQTHGYGTCNDVRKECPYCHLMVFLGNRLVTMAEGYEAETHHFDENGYCSDCGYQCPHAAWNNGVCTNCHYVCLHEYYDYYGQCSTCGYQCPHGDNETVIDDETVQYEWVNAEKHAILTIRKQHDVCTTCHCVGTQTQSAERTEGDHQDTDEDGTCDICGYPTETGPESNWSHNYTTGQGHVLTITGSGRIPDYEDPDNVPWAEDRSEIDQVIIDSGITYIGKNAFAGMSKTVRVNFLEAYKPTVHEDAFTGTTAIFRHYYRNESWPADGAEGSNRWIYLPFYRDDLDEFSTVVYHPAGWSIKDYNINGQKDIVLDSVEQAMEITWRGRNIDLELTPSENDWEVLENNLSRVNSISFFSGCKGTLALTYSQKEAPLNLTVCSPQLNLTITDTNKDPEINGIFQLVMGGGNVTYNGNIQQLILRSSFCESPGSSLTVNGTVDQAHFYGAQNENRYEGSLTVNGEIKEGFEYGNVSMAVPNIDVPVVFNSMVLTRFETIQQTDPVIANGELNVDGVAPISNLTYDMFGLQYMLVSDGWNLELRQKEGSEIGSLYGNPKAFLPDFKPDFSVDDIYWSEDTSIHIWNPRGQGQVVINGPTENGEAMPIGTIWIEGGNVELNCKVDDLILTRRYTEDEPCVVAINGPVTNCYMRLFKKTGNRVTVGENGSIINGGNWERTLNDERYYGPVAAGTDLLEGGQMKVMSWRWGEDIQALMPSDGEMQAATGEYDADIKMDVGASSAEELTENESDALTTYLTDNSIEATDLVAVFDATVTAYSTDESGQITSQREISELNRPVWVVVNNPTGEDCFIARIHEDGEDTTVEAVSKKATATTIPFVSDLFSKYVIIKGNAPYHPQPVEWHYSEGAWLNTLTITGDGVLEDYSAEHPAPWAAYADTIDLISIGEGITGIGANAFAGMGRTVRADFLEETMPEIDEAAFAGTNAVCRYYTQGTAETPWPTGMTANGEGYSLKWIYIPAYIEDGMDGVIRRVEYTANGQWGISVFNTRTMGRDLIPMNVEQIKEATFGKLKDLLLWAMPDEDDLGELWENVNQLAIESPCEGSLTLTLEADDELSIIQVGSENATLTITDPRENGVSELICCNGSITYNGNVQKLILRESLAGENDYLVTVTGNVQEMHFHGPEAGSPYTGSVKVHGTVVKGIVRGRKTLAVPGSEEPIVFDDMITATFENASPADHMIIRNGILQVDAAAKNVSLDMFSLRYYFAVRDGEMHISLGLTPKAEYESEIGSDLCFYPELNITPSQIYYGDDTDITIQTTDDEAGTVVLGVEDETTHEWSGRLRRIDLFYGRAVCNGPVQTVWMTNSAEAGTGSELIINGSAGDLTVSDLRNGSVSLGTGGSIGEGIWIRSNGEERRFGAVQYDDTENGTLYTGRTLRVMSRKDGQQISAKMPSEDELRMAAELTGNLRAMADVNDSSVAELDGEEKGALDDFLAEHEGAVAAIFDATITAYTEDAEGNITPGAAITNLNDPVEFKVSNSTGDECYIVRLHDEGDGMTATQLTESSFNAEIPFESDMFSKYAIIAKNWTEVEEWTGWTFGEVGEGIDKQWVLHITGSGEMPDYSSPAQTPWYAEAAEHENIRIVIDEGVTKVGSNAFGGLKGTVRADFRGATMPTVSTTAFSGTTAKCRYYNENESWTAGISGRTDAQWTYLPRYEEDSPGRFPMNYGYPDISATAPCWYLLDSDGNIPLTTEQAEELSYKCRVLDFDMMPTDTSLFATGNVPWQASFGAGCNGVQFALGATNGANTLERLNINAPGMTLTIDRSTAGEPMEFVEIKSGTVVITGDVTTLSLRNSNGETPCSVTITGDVDEMDFYNASTGGNAYSGDAEIIGTIHRGCEYGLTTMDIPGIGTNVPMENGMQVHAFEDLTRTEADGLIIDDGVLQLEGLAPESHTVSEYRLRYTFTDQTEDEFDATTLVLEPKEGGAETTINILAYNENFTESDIIWGNDTSVNVHWWDPSTPKTITLNGGTDAQGNRTGIYELFTNATVGTINLNCPVNQLEVYQRDSSTNALVLNINSKVEYEATLSLRGNGNTVRLDDFGWLAGGAQYIKPLTSPRVLPAIQGRHDPLIADGRLTVLSHKTNERLESILPGDSDLASAAGMPAVMEISESAEPLSGDELESLEGILTETTAVAEVFDVTVTGYADGATEGATGTQIGELANGTVSMAVKNTTGGEAYVARLHEENGQMTATAVSEATTGDVVWFESDLFSKYVLIGNEPAGDIQHRIAGCRLILEGNGRMEDYATAADAPWYSERDEIKEIILGSGITKIGANAFGGFTNTVRVDFNQSSMPEIAETAFSGSNVICRYYTEDESWPTATSGYGATSIKWVYMPANNQGSDFANIWYYENSSSFGTGWRIYTQTDGEFAVSREVAEEYSFLGRAIYLNAIPQEQADRDMYEAHWDVVNHLYLFPEGTGTGTLTIPASAQHVNMSFDAPGWTMTVDASAVPEGGFGTLFAGSGTLNVTTEKINLIYLQSESGEAGNVTINADVDSLYYYNSSNTSRAFNGNATVNGRITQGYEYGRATAIIPNIPNIVSDEVVLSSFQDTEQNEPVVKNSQLNVEGTVPFAQYTVDNSQLYYTLRTNEDGSDWWKLQINPNTGDGAAGLQIDIADYNPNFTIDDIYWGDYTGLSFHVARPGETVTVNAPEGKGLFYSNVSDTSVIFNCPVTQLDIGDWRAEDGPYQVTLNDTVNSLIMRLENKNCSVILGQGGSINSGYLQRPLYNNLFFENRSSAGPVLQNGWLSVLSHQAGQMISTILPDETTLTTKAGLSDGQVAIMNVTDAGGLTPAEETAFETAQINGTADAAFDVTVTAYDGSGSSIGSVDTLSDEVTITVENVTGGTAYVVRLHDDGSGLEAEALTEPSDAGVFVFESDLFSKYVLVKTEDQIDPSMLLTLKLPDSLTRIEDYAFAGGVFQAVIIPDGCTYIGDYAFQGCDQLVYISYPASYESDGIEIKETAFDGCGKIKVVTRPGNDGR